ncbi:TetR/AcrR family transcriptional regulator [Cryptosporangium phraense]|uniref:TetR/AcrR family transcriptional regulator n=1 Tax=Cryptosporangium phraense TaxID=2593070 RepID=UPI0014784727|nr:TetR/AcrR family transcriptional regulator [Cryptosporangium phraense]
MPYVSSAVRRRQIVLAARRVVEREGLSRASLRAVADEAGIALSTLQHVFSTREALLGAVVEELLFVQSHNPTPLGTPDQPFAEWLSETLQALWEYVIRASPESQLGRLEVTLYAVRTGLTRELARWQSDRIQLWAGKTAALSSWNLRIPVDQVARLVMAMLDGLLLQYLADPDPGRAADDLRHAAQAVAAVAAAPA